MEVKTDFGAIEKRIYLAYPNRTMAQSKNRIIISLLLLAALLYMPIFGHLGSLPIRIWDESRLAVNALEMYLNGDFIVTHFEGEPDMWNTKPPLLIWMQVFFMKVIGVNEVAIRLPSALAALFTCIALVAFSMRYLRNHWFGIIAVLALVTSQNFIAIHATRTGDYDALLTAFTTVSALLFFAFCETRDRRFLYLFFLGTALAVLTKSVAGLMFLPGLALYALYRRRLPDFLRSKHFYFGLLGFAVVVGGYYLLREWKNPGYLTAVHENELGGRYMEVLENHKHGFFYYWDKLIATKPALMYALIPCGWVLGMASKDVRMRRLTVFSFLLTCTFFLIISGSQTKLDWYDVPLYPFYAIAIAIPINFVFALLNDSPRIQTILKTNVVPMLFLFLIFVEPYRAIIGKTYAPKELPWDVDFYELTHFLQRSAKGKHDLDGTFIAFDGYRAHNLFYVELLNHRGVDVSFKDWKDLEPGDVVVAQQQEVKEEIINRYHAEVEESHGGVVTYRIHGEK